MNPRQVSRVALSPEFVEGIVFWTKNPSPLLPRLSELADMGYKSAFQFTLTPYGRDVEPNVPDKNSVLIPIFKELSDRLGAERVNWRYDPIFISERYDFNYHVRAFGKICGKLNAYTKNVTISFVIPYKSIVKNIAPLNISYERPEQLRLAEKLAEIAHTHGLQISACCAAELHSLGIVPAKCIDGTIFGAAIPRDINQRANCNCSKSVDLGEYSTCLHNCSYCYANHTQTRVADKSAAHDVNSPLLIGNLNADDVVRIRAK
jgi:hypothetical protein